MDSESLTTYPGGQSHSGVLDQKTKRRVRHKINTLIYVKLDGDNGGIVRDLSEFGVALQTVAPLRIHQYVHLRFDLPNTRVRVDVVGYVAWASATGRAGIQFTQISLRTRQLLKDWLLINLLSTAAYVSQASGIFTTPKTDNLGDLISSPALGIATAPSKRQLHPNATPEIQDSEEGFFSDLWLEFSWWPVPIAARTLSSAVDALLLIISLLVFWSIFFAICHEMPPWPMSVATAAGALIVFAFVYRFLFVTHGAGTPGFRLALIAAPRNEADEIAEQQLTRFR